MYSPRSVSTTVRPAASIAWSSAASSETIDFDLMILRTACRRAISRTSALISAGVCANNTVAPRARAFSSKIVSQTSRSSSARWRMARAVSRVPSKSSSSASETLRFSTNLPLILVRLYWSCASCSLTCARSLKYIDATCMAFPGNSIVALRQFAGEHFGDMQHARCIAAAAQPPFDVQHATQVAQDDRFRAAGDDVRALVVGEPRRDLAELEGERAAEAAARLALGHFGKPDALHFREQGTRLRLDPHFTQARA